MWEKYKTNIVEIFGIILLIIAIVFTSVIAVQNGNEVSALEEQLRESRTYCTNLEGQLEDAAMTIISLKDENMDLVHTNQELTGMVADLTNEEYEYRYLGKFEITFYCGENYEHICGSGNGITSTGAKVTVGVTIAVDTNILPYGSEVYIAGHGYRIAQDCGSAVNGNHIDIFVSTHAEAMALGKQYRDVWIIVKK